MDSSRGSMVSCQLIYMRISVQLVSVFMPTDCTPSLIRSLPRLLSHSLTHTLAHPPTHPPTHSLTHSPTHSPTHPLTAREDVPVTLNNGKSLKSDSSWFPSTTADALRGCVSKDASTTKFAKRSRIALASYDREEDYVTAGKKWRASKCATHFSAN